MKARFGPLKRLSHIPTWIYWRVQSNVVPLPLAARMWWRGVRTKARVTSPSGPVVSLTTHGARIHKVHLAIESIGSGTLLPSRLILWVDDKALFRNLPAPIQRLQQRGLEVRLCPNYGPHTKYYPYVASESRFPVPLVTADDDQLYASDWLDGLVKGFESRPDVINCYQCHTVALNIDGGIAPYRQWTKSLGEVPSYRQLALGVAGVLYPPAFLEFLKRAGTAFKDCCPTADDLWLHVQALRAGYRVRQVRGKAVVPRAIPGTEGMGLWRHNNSGANDRQIAATYTRDDVAKVQAASTGLMRGGV